LIIDEINRGNVSSIFGELITLIESNKRKGEKETLEVILPYSKQPFTVPANLYIIGTMNTADRSVEALDAALRRRFSFVEMPSKPELVAPNRCFWELLWKYKGIDWDNEEYKSKEKELLELLGASSKIWDERKAIWEQFKTEGKNESQIEQFSKNEFIGINFESILEKINLRIEKLLDKDHQIGHSYFMSVETTDDLKSAFKNKIIPLLQEYFFGDYGKIGLVLGSGFVSVEKKTDSKKLFASFDDSYDASDLAERVIYNIVDVEDKDFDIQTAIENLLNQK
jgi:5-methylcytosine-specific restriction endonuclease McrBC GTP-binding regulatory subunit McrB